MKYRISQRKPAAFRKLCRAAVLCLVVVAVLPPVQAEPKSSGVPRYDAAVRKAVDFLKSKNAEVVEREVTLVAYALLKAGEPVTSPIVAKGIEDAKHRAESKAYTGYDHIYLAGVDAMLLADADSDGNFNALQNIADYVASQLTNGGWSDSRAGDVDTSMSQYGMLALWSAVRAGCNVAPSVIEANARWHLQSGNSDGGWAYRPGTGSGTGAESTHNMAMAGAGSIGIARLLLYGPKNPPKSAKQADEKKFGILEKTELPEDAQQGKGSFANYRPGVNKAAMDARVERAFGWINSRFPPTKHPKNLQKQYFFYALERAAALHDAGNNWFTTYGDLLLTLQDANGSFPKTFTNARIGTCFAILYFMRSTQQIINKQFGSGILKGGRGLDNLFGDKKEKKKDIGPLDALLRQMESADLSKLDDIDTDAVVEKIAFGSKEELIGQIDLLKKLLKHPEASNRQAAFFALGRTGDFSLIPEMLKGLRDPNVDVNVEALMALRYISRKPNGFGLSTTPLAGAETADNERKVRVANAWRTKAYKTWAGWYRKIRPYEEGGGLDEIELLALPNLR